MHLLLTCLLFVAGCTGMDSGSADVDSSGAVTPLDLDVVVTPGSVRVITNGTDRGLCSDENFMFPALDQCVAGDDLINGCWETCLESARLVGDRLLLPGLDVGGIYFRLSGPLPSDTELELTGCGVAAVRIPIQAVTVTSPVVTIQPAGDAVLVNWTADPDVESSLVQYVFSNSGRDCRTASNYHSDTSPFTDERARQVGVTTLLAPIMTTTALGTARVWRGSTTFTNVD